MIREFLRKRKLRIHYITEFDLQFWFTLVLIFVVSVEGIFLGWGINKLSHIAAEWQNPAMTIKFFKTLVFFLVFLMGFNFLLGIYLSHKVAGPLYKLRLAFRELKSGKMMYIRLRRGDLLKDFIAEYNDTMFVVEKVIKRDKNFIKMSLEQIDECMKLVNERHSAKQAEDMKKSLLQLRTFLIAMSSHFKF